MNDVSRRAWVIDDDVIEALQRLIFEDEPLVPTDLRKIELAIRAFILVENLHKVPILSGKPHQSQTRESGDYLAPIEDGVLDYEFVQTPGSIPFLGELSELEAVVVRRLALEPASGPDIGSWDNLPVDDLIKIASDLPLRVIDFNREDETFGRGQSGLGGR